MAIIIAALHPNQLTAFQHCSLRAGWQGNSCVRLLGHRQQSCRSSQLITILNLCDMKSHVCTEHAIYGKGNYKRV